MATSAKHRSGDATPERPEFAVTLGLLPPYAMDDVKRAYLAKVKDAHPDRGGERVAFDRIQQAYQQAGEYLKFRSDRRQWIAARMEEYLAVVELMGRLQTLGAEVDTVTLDWLERSFGEFADLTESIIGVRLQGSGQVAELIDALVADHAILSGMKLLDLSDSPVTDAMAIQLRVFRGLTSLDLGRTQITDRALTLVDWLPGLRELNIGGTPVGWWARRRLQRTLNRRRRAAPDPIFHPTNIR
jgi:hypothetical protein